MPVQLPTDTAHLNLETRQYELFNRPLGPGISRRKLAAGLAVCGVWVTILLVAGVSVTSRFGPTAYILPPFVVVYFGTRTGDDGRMALVMWYDAVLARRPVRRRVIRNPLMAGGYTAQPIRLAVTTELHPRPPGSGALVPLMGRGRGRPRRRPRQQPRPVSRRVRPAVRSAGTQAAPRNGIRS